MATWHKTLLFLGGGHSHAIALQEWGLNPLPEIRVILINDVAYTPYSGMLPGQVAGIYSYDETHIDLRRLARFAGAEFYLDKAVGIDVASKQVICSSRPPVAFDYLAVDIGSTPNTITTPGASRYTIPAKPVSHFLPQWDSIVEQVQQSPQQRICLSIVGGGAGGVELAMNIQAHLARCFRQAHQPETHLELHLFHRGQTLLSGHNLAASRIVEKILKQRGVKLHLGETVKEVTVTQIICNSGLKVSYDSVFWVTQASAPHWLDKCELETDQKGFILVKNTLQSVSHDFVFAAGDIATMRDSPHPKAGVFAVRQGKPLIENLRNIITGKPLQKYQPQQRYLALLGTGNYSAIASWGKLSWHSPLFWQWKDKIDRKFMERFSDLPHQRMSATMYCTGCGSKIGSNTLKSALERLSLPPDDSVILGLSSLDDAAAIAISPADRDTLLVHTVDQFTSLINDPYLFGKIATHHCLSDIWAMGASPKTVLTLVTLPHGTEAIKAEILYQILAGVTEVLAEHHISLVGGHTTEGEDLVLGLACNGMVARSHLLRQDNLQLGQVLILTKPLGTGVLFAGDRQYQAQGKWIDAALESMLLSNQKSAEIFQENGATACTDITGFGLCGHLLNMVKASGVAVEIECDRISFFEGTIELVKKGILSSLQPQNLAIATEIECVPLCGSLRDRDFRNSPQYQLLFDPQTTGGLLASLPSAAAAACLEQLKQAGYQNSQIIGRVVSPGEFKSAIALK
ncbi:MAG: selenide, water dikinase SelD [Jaaginema sp. PMC 1079.18]|nr:selenide, water dikinase SelD [Jaaginema sp. PMC 1080.18]MEC4849935.1 selenide, water dikinase SelD [Jaaginema sp. PMC 1079.18]MEC4865168.1 selenide, water dikinase SelD [Jaaginema sp. PMC 1078.18]